MPTVGEAGGMKLQVKGCLEPQKLEDAKDGFFPTASEGVWACQHIDLRLVSE